MKITDTNVPFHKVTESKMKVTQTTRLETTQQEVTLRPNITMVHKKRSMKRRRKKRKEKKRMND